MRLVIEVDVDGWRETAPGTGIWEVPTDAAVVCRVWQVCMRGKPWRWEVSTGHEYDYGDAPTREAAQAAALAAMPRLLGATVEEGTRATVRFGGWVYGDEVTGELGPVTLRVWHDRLYGWAWKARGSVGLIAVQGAPSLWHAKRAALQAAAQALGAELEGLE